MLYNIYSMAGDYANMLQGRDVYGEDETVAQRDARIAKREREAAQREAREREAQKKSVCDFFNSLDVVYFGRRLKETKQLFTKYEQFDEQAIFATMKDLKETEKELGSFLTFRDETIQRLNSKRDLLSDKVSKMYSANTFVEDLYKTYARSKGITFTNDEIGDKKLVASKKVFPVSDFFSYLNNCELVNTKVVNTKVVNTKDIEFKNKYLKYKQKYLSLKNKIN